MSSPPDEDTRCPSEDALADFLAGKAGPEAREILERHLDACERCATTLAFYGGAFGGNVSASDCNASVPAEDDPLPAPTTACIGERYELGECVGFGAGGVVYRARDLELGRDVALKWLRSASDPHLHERWRREAMVMAAVSHPNVVTVYDVGVHEGRMFIASEFIDGGTLEAWLAAARRPWREILERFLGAARGLAAIHASGLVHRDFKPQNVMVGKDGRVRVTDFGLARLLPNGSTTIDEEATEPALVLGSTLTTRTGALVGTPAYMSPEQWRGQGATPRSDQYALCLSLYEAVCGRRAFAGKSAVELARQVCHTTPEWPGHVRVPVWLRRAIMKGLAQKPEQRHADMQAFIDAVTLVPRKRRARALAAGTLVGFVGVAAAGYQVAQVQRDACQVDETRTAALWNDARKDEVRAALGPTMTPRVVESIDAWLEAWRAEVVDACEARRRGGSNERQYALQRACLDRQLGTLAVVAEVLPRVADPESEAALELTGTLGRPDACADPEGLERIEPDWTDMDAQLLSNALAADVDRAEALGVAGREAEALALAERVLARARASEDSAVRSEALECLGEALSGIDQFERAREVLYDAVWHAEASGHVRMAAWSWIELVHVLPELGHLDEAEAAAKRASAAVKRFRDPEAELVLAANLGVLASLQGRYEEALAQHQRVLERGLDVWGEDNYQISRVHVNVAATLTHLGRHPEALEHARQAVAQHEARFQGPHPLGVQLLSNLAVLEQQNHHTEAAIATLERALAQADRVFPADHPTRATILVNLAYMEREQGKLDRSLALQQEALAMRRRLNGEEHPDVASAMHNLASLLEALGRVDEAVSLYRETLALRQRVSGEAHPDTANTMHNLGLMLANGDTLDEGIALLEQALALRIEANVDPFRRGASAFMLARAYDRRGDPQQAMEHARQSLAWMQSTQPLQTQLVAQIEKWIADRDPGPK